MAEAATAYNFGAMHTAMEKYVEREIVSGISTAVLVGQELADQHCVGWADKESGIAMREDHIFRVFSNTKLVTTCAALLLYEEGRFGLDDPVEQFIAQLANRRVLRPGATTLDDTEPAASPITIRHLMSHSAGLSYGFLDPTGPLSAAYIKRKVLHFANSLAQMTDVLADLPLAFHPGTSWEYSVATDVLARLVEVVSGEPFDVFIKARIFEPLGMRDTGFVVPADKRHRLAAYYAGADMRSSMLPGLTRIDNSPFPGAFVQDIAFKSGGGGLVSTLPDMLALVRSLIPGGVPLLRPQTVDMMMTNQLAEGVYLRFPGIGEVPGKVFGLGGALTMTPSSIDPADSVGEFQWGGIGGTHWWINREKNIAGLLMTQREMSFWHPFSFEFKRLAYQAVV
jgi:CubicO group peptidase (beta-lactamase class C family)